ncbi:MAG TPA: NUDIX domain-containing protein [Candidatus Saccharimonadales bacterium]|nr:NUDIX domain-containing protein [Candidatus Saccharimonadales bacterium]
MTHKILVVNDNDQPIGEFSKEEVWEKGLLHRIVRIMVEDEEGRILLQKRSMQVDTFPGCWDHSAAGHVDAGEDYEEAAKRELHEELGISNATLHKIAVYRTSNTFNGRKLNRFNALYKATIDASQPLNLQESEVGEAKWFTLDEVKELVAEQPDNVTDGLAQVISDYYAKETQGEH